MNFPIIHRNERDVETPMLLKVGGEMRGKISSYLDVGACHSHTTYAGAMRQVLDGVVYHAVDLEYCQETWEIVDDYLVGDVRALVSQYDLVSCISVIEHVGIQTKQLEKSLRLERVRFFRRLVDRTKARLVVTFPYGEFDRCSTYANLTSLNLSDFMANAFHLGLEDQSIRFFFNEFPQAGLEWNEISAETAEGIPMVLERGVQCVCVFDAQRKTNGNP